MAPFDPSALVDRASALVDAAKAAGADAADAVAIHGVSESVEIREGVVEESERAENDDLGLRVFIGARSAIVSTNDMDRKAFPALAERAVAMARVAPENPMSGLADPAHLANGESDLDLLDPTELNTDHLIDMAKTAEAAALGTKGITKSGGATASTGLAGVGLATSAGFAGAYQRSRFGLSATAIGGEGTGMERDYDFSATVHFDELDDPANIGRSAADRTLRRLNPRQVETRTAPVIFENRVASGLLSDLSGAINGSAIVRGASFLADKLGQQIMPADVTVRDDPGAPRRLGSRPFDGEGVATQPLDVVQDGQLTSWLLDSATARELGLDTNGHATRTVSTAPSPSATNVTFLGGDGSLQDMIARIGTGLLVTSAFGRGVNLVTGDYSRGVSGLWFENGEIAYPVSEITIAGHLTTMFKALEAAGDLVIRGAVNAPSLLVGEMTIAGQ